MRQNIKVNPAVKEFESYTDFSGGLNSEISNEKLRENEYPVMQNADISSRGSAKRRPGRVKIFGIEGTAQGMFHYYREGQSAPDIILAISGKLYLKRNGENTATEMPITYNDEPFVFQDELPVEAVQYRTDLFVATGTKIVEINYDFLADTFTAGIMAPYKPTVQEVINIGTNALASDPATWIQEKEDSVVSIEGITTSIPQGVVNSAVTFTAHVKKPESVNVHYSFSWRKTGSGTYNYILTDSPNNYADITFNEIGGYDIKAETKQVTYLIDDYTSLWTSTQAGITQTLGTHDWDGQLYQNPSLILTTNGGTYDTSLPLVTKNLSTPLDLTKGNTITWYVSIYSPEAPGYTIPQGAVKLAFYNDVSSTTPILTLESPDGISDRSLGTSWTKITSTYDSSITGLDNIVKMGFFSLTVGTPATAWNLVTDATSSTTDHSTRIDQTSMYMSNTETSYVKTNFEVVGVVDPTTDPSTYEAIHSSRMIRLHYDKLLLGKDSKYPGQIYLSQNFNPRYFPSSNAMDFSLDRREPVTEVVRYQDFLVVFTKSTISSVVGKVTSEITVSLINDHIGCIADRSAKVAGNNIIFLSQEGVMMLRPNQYKLAQMNVQRIDYPIKSEITSDTNACAMVYDNQYWLSFPDKNTIYRLNYDKGVWVKDTSSKLNISQFLTYGNDVFNLSTDGVLYKHDNSVFTDDGESYTMVVETKMLDLSATFNNKKLKNIYIMAKHYADHRVDLNVRVYADSQIVLTPDSGQVVIDPDTLETTWQTTTDPNFKYANATQFGTWKLGESVLGDVNMSVQKSAITSRKCRRVKVSFEHNLPSSCEIFGFGLEFRLIKP
jgi:hypothetical protein